MGGKKKVCQEHDSIEKEIIVLGHSYWGKLSSYQCYTPFCPAKKLRISGATVKRYTIKECSC